MRVARVNPSRLAGALADDLVDGSAHLVARQSDDHALDLPPVAKADDIVVVAAALGARRGLERGVVAEAVDELGCCGQSGPAGDEDRLHGR